MLSLMETPPRFRFGPFELDPGTFKLLKNGEAVSLEPKGIDLLRLLLERAPRVVEKSEIFSIIWKDVAVTDNALTRLVTQIRRVLEDDPKTPRFVETIATRGYRFVADVHRLTDDDRAAQAPPPPVAIGGTRAKRRFGRIPLSYAALGALVVLSTAALVGSRLARRSETETWLTDAGIPDVVKLAALKPEQVTAGKSYDGFLSFAPDGKSVTFASDRSGALEIYVQSAAAGSTATALTTNGRHSVQPAWSPDGQFIAYHEIAGNGIWVVPSRGGVARKVSDFGANPSWSADGRRIAFQSLPVTSLEGFGVPGALSTIWLADAFGSSDPIQLTKPGEPAGPHLAPHWLQDGNHLLFAAISSETFGGGTSLWNIDVQSRQRRQVLSDKRLTPDYAIAPNGRAVYFVSSVSDTIWWLPLGPEGTWKADPQPTGLAVSASQIAHLTISPDGRRLGWTGLEPSIQLWAMGENATGSEGAFPLVQGLGVRYGLPSPSRDGRLAFIGERAGSNINLFLLAPPASMRQITADKANHRGSQWLPGEREIAYVTDLPEGAGFAAIDPESGRTRPLFVLSNLPHPPGPSQPSTAAPTTNIAFNPDFTALAMAIVQDGRPNVWLAGLQNQRPDGTLTQLTFEREGGSYPVWSSDGRWVAYQCNEGADTNVCVTRAEGGGRIQLTHEPGQSWVGGWKSDNDTVLFAAERNGVWNVESVSRTTGKIQILTEFNAPQGHVRYPRWDPAHRQIIFEVAQTTGRIWTVDLPQ
jgi:Tol biopolymer transport system component/DNA-binding winged helix-turn-helix (wHTH) protein